MDCRICTAPLAQKPTGRPPTYCGELCRRLAEHEVRRLQRRLTTLEADQSDARITLAMASTGTPERNKRHINALQAEIDLARARLREVTRAPAPGGVGG
jgi:hypothetical protein